MDQFELDDEELEHYAWRIKRIARLPHPAIQEVKALTTELIERGACLNLTITSTVTDITAHIHYSVESTIESLEAQLQSARAHLKAAPLSQVEQNVGNELEYYANEVRGAVQDAQEQGKIDADTVKKAMRLCMEAYEVTNKLKIAWAKQYLANVQSLTVYNISSVRMLVREMTNCENILTSFNLLSPEDKERIRKKKEECAWFRTRKKLHEASSAQKLGNLKKSHKLKIEAETILEQDWNLVFPDQTCPGLIEQ